MLCGQGLTKIPDDVFRLDKIQRLDLSRNRLAEVDARLAQCRALTDLDLSRNGLKAIPAELAELPLSSLRLEGNPLAAPYDALLKLDPASIPGKLAELSARGRPTRAARESDAVESCLAPATADPLSWRKERLTLLAQIEELRQQQTAPSWMAGTRRLNLPSQQDEKEVAQDREKLRDQVQQEQARSQRVERELAKVNERVKELGMMSGNGHEQVCLLASFDDVAVGEEISQGGFAVVSRAVWQQLPCAAKVIVDPAITDELLEDFDNEVAMLSRLRHPRILQLLAVCRSSPHLGFLAELADSTLYFHLHHPSNARSPGALAPRAVNLELMHQVAQALVYLHYMSVVHRDMKSPNVLLVQDQVKLCDFGLARKKSDLGTGRMQFGGTPAYMAPELFRKQSYTEKVDVFAFGALLYEALTFEVPFDGLEGCQIADKWETGTAPPPLPATLGPDLRQLVLQAWAPRASTRPSMPELCESLADFLR